MKLKMLLAVVVVIQSSLPYVFAETPNLVIDIDPSSQMQFAEKQTDLNKQFRLSNGKRVQLYLYTLSEPENVIHSVERGRDDKKKIREIVESEKRLFSTLLSSEMDWVSEDAGYSVYFRLKFSRLEDPRWVSRYTAGVAQMHCFVNQVREVVEVLREPKHAKTLINMKGGDPGELVSIRMQDFTRYPNTLKRERKIAIQAGKSPNFELMAVLDNDGCHVVTRAELAKIFESWEAKFEKSASDNQVLEQSLSDAEAELESVLKQ